MVYQNLPVSDVGECLKVQDAVACHRNSVGSGKVDLLLVGVLLVFLDHGKTECVAKAIKTGLEAS